MAEGVRVRFAPAPTGHLHIGNIRTYLFNWLFARHHKGKMILRIEDTDVARAAERACETVVDDLRWLGLDWDEGYGVGGLYGPYRQSERLDIYRKYAKALISEGKAYFCFCSKEELEEERKAYLAKGKMPRYSGKCQNLSQDDIKRLSKDRVPAVRFRVPAGTITLSDMVKGRITFDSSVIGDFVILRSDGSPTYNFAVVIDDAEMKISHIIRGDEHISNTPRQIMIYQALGFSIPKLGHVAMILGQDKTKLSKRHGAMSLSCYKKAGYLPDAILNHLVFLGWTPEHTREIMSLKEIQDEFSLDRISRSPSIFDPKKLDWFNSQYIRMSDPDRLLDKALPYLGKFGINEDSLLIDEERERLKKIVLLIKDSVSKLSEIPEETFFFFVDEIKVCDKSVIKWLKNATAGPALAGFIQVFSHINITRFNSEEINVGLKKVIDDLGIGARKTLMPIRVALTGRTKGPELHAIIDILGKEKSIRRAETALSGIRGNLDGATGL
ncbi:MAG: glutamate--tRNA ligase [Firmicutes bacterium]|nr:glutamate--tRNA ligase [Bacillota bacterium]